MKYAILSSLLFLVACGVQTDIRQQSANHIARPAFLSERFINAQGFQLQTWERMHKRDSEATIYIEGDSHIIGATTPYHPVALELAAHDNAKNIGYLGRPCQFIKMPQSKGCGNTYWTDRLYTEEIITAYEIALNDIVKTYGITGIHLVGYDGGANIAAILTARNKNILSLRTVAGNLNPELTNKIDQTDAVYAVDYGSKLATVPQMHFIGGLDTYITPEIYHSYRQAVGLSECINFQIVPGSAHKHGWAEVWPTLLKTALPYCKETYKELPLPEPTPMEIPETRYEKLAK